MWVKTTAKFRPDDISDVLWDSYSTKKQDELCECREFHFNSSEIVCYNESSDGGTTIYFKTHDRITIEMPINEVANLITNVGKSA